jgi:hypothetical protein
MVGTRFGDPVSHVQGKPSANVTKRVRRNSKKKRRDIQRRTRGSASLPAPAKWLGPITSTVHTNIHQHRISRAYNDLPLAFCDS